MSEHEFINFITKGIKIEKDGQDRIFEGHITAEIVDRQGEIIAVDQVMKAMENYMAVLPVLTEVHSNRVVAKALEFKKSEIEGHPSVWIKAQVFKKDGVTLYDQVWEKIVKGEYRGLSMGGASKNRESIIKDGRIVMKLSNLEIYEIAICPTPANPLAIIKYVNEFAKAANMVEKIKIREDGMPFLQCNSVVCSVEKGSDIDTDKDADNGKDDGSVMERSVIKGEYILKIKIDDSDIQKLKKELEHFQKPFGGYANFEECERENRDKGNTGAYCGEIKHRTEDTKKEYKDGTTRATQAEMDEVNRKYKDEGEKKKDELTQSGFASVEAPIKGVTQEDIKEKDLVYKCRDMQHDILTKTLLENTLI